MASERLSGHREISKIHEHDVGHEPGVYLFYRTINGPVRYGGRSDNSLHNRN